MANDFSSHTDHCTDSQLARLAEGDVSVRDEVDWKHLASCGECMGAYLEATEFRSRELAGVEPVPVSGELLLEGKELGPEPVIAGLPGRARSGPGRLVSGGVVAAVLALLIWIPLRSGGPETGNADRPAGLFAPIETALVAHYSAELVLPGCATIPDVTDSPLRGPSSAQDALETSLTWMDEKYRSAGLDDEEFYWYVGGYMAQGELLRARALLAGMRARQSDDPRLGILRAAMAYRQNDLEAASEFLIAALNADPGDDVARLNLAVVEADQGRFEDARLQLERIGTHADNPLLDQRAARLWDRISGR